MENAKHFLRTLLFTLFICPPLMAAGLEPAFNLEGLFKSDIPAAYTPLSGRAPAAARVEAAGPVVITVPCLDLGKVGGGPFQLKYIIAAINYFTPDTRSANKRAIETAVSEVVRNYYGLPEGMELPDEPAAETRKLDPTPDDYLDKKLAEIPGYSEGRITVVPFQWSRDPEDTHATVPDFENRLVELYTAGRTSGRPIYILAHSWGSVLIHETLQRLAVSHPEIKIDNLVTIGSPLVPSNAVLKIFLRLEIAKEGLGIKVTKPANVRVWRNFWASRDFFSNSIPAADENIQVDAKAEPLEPALRKIIWANPLSSAARTATADLLKYLSLYDWHNSYIYDYKAILKSIEKEVSLPIFKPLVEPRLIIAEK